jgi:hypothetical protein
MAINVLFSLRDRTSEVEVEFPVQVAILRFVLLTYCTTYAAQYKSQFHYVFNVNPGNQGARSFFFSSLEEIKSRLHSVNACYHSVQKRFFSRLPSTNTKIRIYKNLNLPVVLYGCEIWSLTLREKHRLKVFENRALRRIFGPKRNEVTGGWRKLHNEENNKLYSSPSIIKIINSKRMR